MIIINGKEISAKIRTNLKEEIRKLETKPGLGIILVGTRKDSETYVRMKKKACEEVGIYNKDIVLSETISEDELLNHVELLNEDPLIHGILIQLPLPKHINEQNVLKHVKLEKDVDGFHPENVGNLTLKRLDNLLVSCTPQGCIELLDAYNIEISGKNVVVLGRSNIVGIPMSLLLLHRNATVTICHSKTQDLKSHTKNAHIIICACGQAKMLTKEYINENVVIIDVGINSIEDKTRKSGYRLVGDADYEDLKDNVKAITPVPGGVGPMTIAMLLKNTLIACINST
jgi:5,10-methylene-tetrahydrofolate dehydrogenase/methenyl tetrahydrofolate cyclohydrolase